MKFISFKLFSARNVIQLDEPIRFNKIRVNKIRYKTSGDYGGILSINLTGLNTNDYLDATTKYKYFYSLFVSDANNQIINFINPDIRWSYDGSERIFNTFSFKILIDGIEDANITINNPFLIELEYEEIENNLLEIDDFFDVIMKQNTL